MSGSIEVLHHVYRGEIILWNGYVRQIFNSKRNEPSARIDLHKVELVIGAAPGRKADSTGGPVVVGQGGEPVTNGIATVVALPPSRGHKSGRIVPEPSVAGIATEPLLTTNRPTNK